MDTIVHLCSRREWEAAQAAGEYGDGSLEAVGFIHFSRPEQILAVANRFYPGAAGMVLLWVDPGQLQAELRWEESDGQIFPHLYGPLNLDAVRAVRDFTPDVDGVFRVLQ